MWKKLLQKFWEEKAFTLLELMVVVTILGIMAALVIPVFSNNTDEARTKKTKGDLRTIESAVELKAMEGTTVTSLSTLVPERLKQVPKDGWGNAYEYDSSLGFYSKGKNSIGGDSDDITLSSLNTYPY